MEPVTEDFSLPAHTEKLLGEKRLWYSSYCTSTDRRRHPVPPLRTRPCWSSLNAGGLLQTRARRETPAEHQENRLTLP